MRKTIAKYAIRTMFTCCLALSTSALASAIEQAVPMETDSAIPAGEAFISSSGIKLVYIPAGEFSMGSRTDTLERFDDEMPHEVTISQGFFMAATEISQSHFQKVMGRNLSKRKGPNLPVTNISWADATVFCKKLSLIEKRSYRLPTEAEWEYACRAGSPSAPSDAKKRNESAWHSDNSGEQIHPVGEKKANPWGLHDMLGNAAEWCADWYLADYGDDEATDPSGPAEGNRRVVRGGSWDHRPRASRPSARMSVSPAYQLSHVGFRIVLEVQQSADEYSKAIKKNVEGAKK